MKTLHTPAPQIRTGRSRVIRLVPPYTSAGGTSSLYAKSDHLSCASFGIVSSSRFSKETFEVDRLDLTCARSFNPDIVFGKPLAFCNGTDRDNTGIGKIDGGLLLGQNVLCATQCQMDSPRACKSSCNSCGSREIGTSGPGQVLSEVKCFSKMLAPSPLQRNRCSFPLNDH